jgi:hypothetical protein
MDSSMIMLSGMMMLDWNLFVGWSLMMNNMISVIVIGWIFGKDNDSEEIMFLEVS